METRAIPGFQQQPASEPSRAWLYNAKNSNPERDHSADAIEAGLRGYGELKRSVDSRRQLPDADDFPALWPWRRTLPPSSGGVSNVKM